MLARGKVLQALVIAAMWVCASHAQGQLVPPGQKAKSGTLDAWSLNGTTGTSKPVDGPATKAAPEKKEKRGNTPPGKDRAGDGPASGAIVDPAGVTTK